MMTLLKGGTLINAAGPSGDMDVLMGDGVVLRIGQDIEEEDARVVDCRGMLIMPGLVDIHCHLRDPGQEYKETIATGTFAAAHGGFTTVCCMANTDPVNDCAAVTRAILEKARDEGVVRVYPVGAITKGLEGKELSEAGEMLKAGVVALSDDGKAVADPRLLRNAMLYSLSFGLPLLSHCEDPAITADGQMNEGIMSTVLGLKGIPRSSEESIIARDILLAGETGAQLHIQHVSTRYGVELVRLAKERGQRVTAETCPHYLTLTDEAVEGYDTNAKVNPPLRSRDDVEAVIEGLMSGVIDCIATDHAPHHSDEKNCEFALAKSGIAGFETAFAIVWTYLVKTGRMTPAQLAEKMSLNPARILKLLPNGMVSVGYPADLIIVDPNEEWVVDPSKLLSKGKNTPYKGMTLTGRVKATYVESEPVYEEGFR